jgi:AcrR family transcriptional regulator
MRRRGLTPEGIRQAAVSIIEAEGADALTMQSLASALGVKAPSLYNHVSSLAEVCGELASEGLRQVSQVVRNAAVGRSSDAALREMAKAYRAFASAHPELYRAFTYNLPRLKDRSVGEAASELVSALRQVLGAYQLDDDEAAHFMRAYRSALHGFVSLEAAGFFAGDPCTDESFTFTVEALLVTLNTRVLA